MKANRSKNLGLVKSHKVIDLNRNISARAGTRKNTKRPDVIQFTCLVERRDHKNVDGIVKFA